MAENTGTPQAPRLTPGKKLFFTLVLTGVLLGLCELLSHTLLAFVLLPMPTRIRSDAYMAPDPVLGWVLAPGASQRIVEQPKGFDFTVRTGAGFRLDAQDIRRAADCAIVTIGDSHVFGYGLREDQTLAFQLHRLLSEERRPVLVFNGGVPSYGLDQYCLRLRSLGRLAKDSLVVVYINPVNDIRNLSRDIDYASFRPYARLAGSGVRYVRPVLYKPNRDFHFAPDFDALNRAFRVPPPPPPPPGAKLSRWSRTVRLLSGLLAKRYRLKWKPLQPTKAVGPYQDGYEYELDFHRRVRKGALAYAAGEWPVISDFAAERRTAEELTFAILSDMKRHAAKQRAGLLVVIAEEAYGKQGFFRRIQDTLRRELPRFGYDEDWARQAVRRAAEKADIPFLMMEYPADRVESMFVPYDGHTTAEGFSFVARKIADWLATRRFPFMEGRRPVQAPDPTSPAINALDGNGYAPLHYAVQDGDARAVGRLLSEGADVNLKDRWGETPAYIAANRGHTLILEMLEADGADLQASDHRDQSPLHQAVSSGYKDAVDFLLAAGVDVNAVNKEGQTPLDIALALKRRDVAARLRSQGGTGDLNIHTAAQWGDIGRIGMLLDRGGDVNAKGPNGRTPLHLAAGNAQAATAEWLISKGADPGARDAKGDTPLDAAVLNDDARMVKILIARGAKCDAESPDGWTAFRLAASLGRREIAELMTAEGLDVSSLPLAAGAGKLARVRELLEKGADLNAPDAHGWTPLYWAVSLDRAETARFLASRGADVRAKTKVNGTALHQAAQAGNPALAELMLAKGAGVNAKTKRWITPLHNAAAAGRAEIAALLVAKGAEVDAKARDGQTPLHLAAAAGHIKVVEVLAANGADLNAKQKNGQTPLHLAVQQGRLDMTALLIRKGADANARNNRERTPLDIALSSVEREIIELLRKVPPAD